MAKIVGGIGMAHSSLVVAPEPNLWAAHNIIDRQNPHLRTKAGKPVSYEELEQLQGANYVVQSGADHLGGQIKQTVAAVTRLREDLAALSPDVIITFGDDQEELHTPENHPMLAVYFGETLTMGTSMRFVTYEEVLGDASPMMRGYAMDARHEFPGHAPLARHLISSLVEQKFDVAAVSKVPDDGVTGLGHSFGIMETQLMKTPGAIPQIPVLVNTYWEPNQLPVDRAYDLGLAVRRAVESFEEDLRVVVVASGGLSHFTTDEQLDRRVLSACRVHDESALRGLDQAKLNGGSSEIRNWVATAAACRDLPYSWDEYVPVYRTPAGTGIGLAFALWGAEVS
jgi:Catalytic LigB subunit of aromatic ring-opening dioxygenase